MYMYACKHYWSNVAYTLEWNIYFPTHLSVAVHAKSISSSSSPVSEESSESLLSFFAFLDLGSLSPAVFVLAGRFPFPLVPCKVILRINQNANR